MTAAELHLVVPGSLAQNTGGYLYDARIVNELRQRAWRVTVHNLEGAFPVVDNQARASITQALEACPVPPDACRTPVHHAPAVAFWISDSALSFFCEYCPWQFLSYLPRIPGLGC